MSRVRDNHDTLHGEVVMWLWMMTAMAFEVPSDVASATVETLVASLQQRSRVQVLGDLDGDGLDEVAVNGSWQVPCAGSGTCSEGRVHIYGDLASGPPAPTWWLGGDPGLRAGLGVGAAGLDADCDGVQDLALTTWGGNGAVHVWFGPLTPGEIRIEDADLVLDGGGLDLLGTSLLALPDLNGDGCDDMAVSAMTGGFNGDGAIYVVTDLWHHVGQVRIEDTERIEYSAEGSTWDLSNELRLIEDLDGDGLPEIVGSGPRTSRGTGAGRVAGEVYVIGELALAVAATPTDAGLFANSRRLNGFLGRAGSNNGLGWDLDVADLDGDGMEDLVVGTPWAGITGSPGGAVYLVSGHELAAIPLGQEARISTVARRIQAPYRTQFGWSLATGDFDGDGDDDLLVGDGAIRGGRVFMARGPMSLRAGLTHRFRPHAIRGVTGVEYFGFGVASLPDQTGDGRPEAVVLYERPGTDRLGLMVFSAP